MIPYKGTRNRLASVLRGKNAKSASRNDLKSVLHGKYDKSAPRTGIKLTRRFQILKFSKQQKTEPPSAQSFSLIQPVTGSNPHNTGVNCP